ncbi:hypothetical protein [Azospirillum sp. TSO5]|nr:hypothetical protein [Azospirillum sp. TSO5]
MSRYWKKQLNATVRAIHNEIVNAQARSSRDHDAHQRPRKHMPRYAPV